MCMGGSPEFPDEMAVDAAEAAEEAALAALAAAEAAELDPASCRPGIPT